MNIQNIIDHIYETTKKNKKGKVAKYIPELANVDPNLYGIVFITCDGTMYKAGNTTTCVSIQSISKVFTLAMAVETLGISTINKKIGNEGSSLPFNSIISAELSKSHTVNPFVNQGAISTTSLFYNKNKNTFRNKIHNNIERFAGRKLKWNKKVYDSEKKTNATNMALAYIMKSYNKIYGDVDDSVDVYTSQCSLYVNAKDLAIMASVFASGGVHPINNKQIISQKTANYVYRSLRGEGLYEYSGRWDTDVGCISAKSGVSGGIMIILKGIGGIGIISPKLDQTGNSVRGIIAGRQLSNKLYEYYNARRKFCHVNINDS